MYNHKFVIVTLTTIPSRLYNILPTIESIINQEIEPDEIVLSLPLESKREPKPNQDPYDKNIIKKILDKTNITIIRCNIDYGPATKLLGLLEREKNKNLSPDDEALIITLDDDKIYDKETTKNLLEGWNRNKDCVVARKGCTFIQLSKDSESYLSNKTQLDKIDRQKEILIIGNLIDVDTSCSIILGTGGVLYKASFFKNDIFNYEDNNKKYPRKEMFSRDDILFSGYLGKNGITKKIIKFKNNNTTNKINEYFRKQNKDNSTGAIDLDSTNRRVNPLININSKSPYDSFKCVFFFKDYLLTL